MRNQKWTATALTAALAGTTLMACSSDAKPDEPLKKFVAAWQSGKLAGLTLLDGAGGALTGDAAQTQLTGLEGELKDRRPTLSVAGNPKVQKNTATATVNVNWPVATGVNWTYQTTVKLTKQKDKWIPQFSPQTVHPDLNAGAKLTVKTTTPERGSILDGAGQPIVSNRPVTIVGVEPQRISDQGVLISTLKSIFKEINADVNVDQLPDKIKNAKKDAFVEIATLRKEDYDKVAFDFKNLSGIVTRDTSLPLAPTKNFARALLGQTGEVTKEIMDKNPGKYRVGDRVGLTGLQQRYDDRLRGTPGIKVQAGDKKLFEQAAVGGAPIKTTIDQKVQNAADSALSGQTLRASIVAIKVSTSQVVAVANSPNGGQLNLGFTAQVPPGSMMKTVTALNLFDAGKITPDTPQDCPVHVTVNGRQFKNAGNETFPAVPFKTEFAKSCNNAFVQLAPQMGPGGLATTAKTLGLGIDWDMGIDAYSGKVSQGSTPEELAASSFGQGQTTVSPIAMAAASAAIARGQWKQPAILTDPTAAKPAPDGPALKQQSVDYLKVIMREAVVSGTGAEVRNLPGAPAYGKTGTAEFDDTDLTKRHSWFMGFKGDLAFAVFVENGGSSTEAAVPLTGKFFLTLGA